MPTRAVISSGLGSSDVAHTSASDTLIRVKLRLIPIVPIPIIVRIVLGYLSITGHAMITTLVPGLIVIRINTGDQRVTIHVFLAAVPSLSWSLGRGIFHRTRLFALRINVVKT